MKREKRKKKRGCSLHRIIISKLLRKNKSITDFLTLAMIHRATKCYWEITFNVFILYYWKRVNLLTKLVSRWPEDPKSPPSQFQSGSMIFSSSFLDQYLEPPFKHFSLSFPFVRRLDEHWAMPFPVYFSRAS